MSRIGKKQIDLPDSVSVAVDKNKVVVKGPLGELGVTVPYGIEVVKTSEGISVKRRNESKYSKSLHGLVRQLIGNAVLGVTKGFQKELELVGMGYRAAKEGEDLSLSLGYPEPVKFPAPNGITFELDGVTKIIVKGIDKALIGNTAAKIRTLRPPEPYKGKGIRYLGEVVRKKAGKSAKAGIGAGGKA